MKVRNTLSVDAARSLRPDLKRALTEFANGRGSVDAVLHEIERIAKYVSGKPRITLGQAKDRMREFVAEYAPARLDDTGLPGVGWLELYDRVVDCRNDIAHTGTAAALAGTRVTTLATVLLAALADRARGEEMRCVKDVMVSNPVCAHGWQTLADLRRTMLVNDFSALPLSDGLNEDGSWRCVRAEELAAALAREDDVPRVRTLAELLSDEHESSRFIYRAIVVKEKEPRASLLGEAALQLPVVVMRSDAGLTELVGIVTAFDLL